MEEPDSDFGFILQTSDSDVRFRLQILDFKFQISIVSIPSPDSDFHIVSILSTHRHISKPDITETKQNGSN